MKVRIIQLLCPERHCILAVTYQTEDGKEDPDKTALLRTTFERSVAAKVIDPWCGICKSRNLVYEDRPTIFATMDEARPFLEQSEADQLASRRFLDASKG